MEEDGVAGEQEGGQHVFHVPRRVGDLPRGALGVQRHQRDAGDAEDDGRAFLEGHGLLRGTGRGCGGGGGRHQRRGRRGSGYVQFGALLWSCCAGGRAFGKKGGENLRFFFGSD